jgi:hypothetical protein
MPRPTLINPLSPLSSFSLSIDPRPKQPSLSLSLLSLSFFSRSTPDPINLLSLGSLCTEQSLSACSRLTQRLSSIGVGPTWISMRSRSQCSCKATRG